MAPIGRYVGKSIPTLPVSTLLRLNQARISSVSSSRIARSRCTRRTSKPDWDHPGRQVRNNRSIASYHWSTQPVTNPAGASKPEASHRYTEDRGPCGIGCRASGRRSQEAALGIRGRDGAAPLDQVKSQYQGDSKEQLRIQCNGALGQGDRAWRLAQSVCSELQTYRPENEASRLETPNDMSLRVKVSRFCSAETMSASGRIPVTGLSPHPPRPHADIERTRARP